MIVWRFFLRFFCALCIGCIIVIWYAHYDKQLLKQLQNTVIRSIENQSNCTCSLRVRSYNLIFPELILDDVIVQECADKAASAWCWHADHIVIRFSWLYFLLHGALDVHVSLHGVEADSTLDVSGNVPLWNHILSFFMSESPIPVIIKEVVLDKSNLMLKNSATDFVFTTTASGSMASLVDCFKVIVYSTDGSVLRTDSFPSLHYLDATTLVEIPYKQGASSTVRISGSCDVVSPKTTTETLSFSGMYQNSLGSFSLSNADGSFVIPHLNICATAQEIKADMTGLLSLQHITPYAPSLLSSITGGIALQAHIGYKKNKFSVDGTMTVNNLAYGMYPLGTATICCKRSNGQWNGTTEFQKNNTSIAHGDWYFDEANKSGFCNLKNSMPLAIFGTRFWAIQSHDATLECSVDGDHIQGVCSVRATNEKLESSLDGVSRFDIHNNLCTLDGGVGTTSFSAVFDTQSASLLQSCTCADEFGTTLITGKSDENNPGSIQAEIAFPLLKQLSSYFFDVPLGGQGVVRCTIQPQEHGLNASFLLSDGTIRLLQTHNFIRDGRASINVDMQKGRLQIHDFLIQLQKGSLKSQCCTVYFDDQGQLVFAHVPLFAHKLFLNINKDMFVVLSGCLLGTYSPSAGSAVTGTIILDRGQIKKNIFSSVAQKSLIASAGTLAPFPGCECALAINVETKAPVHVKTSGLDAHITAHGKVSGTIGAPQLSGGIDLTNGSIAFPYRSLPIVSAKIFSTPISQTDPTIDLVARGKVKKYQITLRVDGTVSHPRISFESSPPLTEEQIITLLLSGSDDGSLALAMPALVMHNVQNLLFGDEQVLSPHENFIKNVLKPLKMVRIVPNFSDQQARGGIRGSLIIDLDDRFHALIQKNFSLPEDTRFEVEYHVSDDMTVRAIKDEHSDLGGEVEMRWKF